MWSKHELKGSQTIFLDHCIHAIPEGVLIPKTKIGPLKLYHLFLLNFQLLLNQSPDTRKKTKQKQSNKNNKH